MEYIEPLPTCDKILELFTAHSPAGFTHSGINQNLGYKNGSPESGYVLSALYKLIDDGYLLSYGMDNSYYKVSGDTFTFKAGGSYLGLCNREKTKNEIKEALDELGFKSAQSVVDTNTSIQTLNAKTGVFYKNQTEYNKSQKLLTLAILLSSVIYTITAITTCNDNRAIQSHNKSIEQRLDKIEPLLNDLKDKVSSKKP